MILAAGWTPGGEPNTIKLHKNYRQHCEPNTCTIKLCKNYRPEKNFGLHCSKQGSDNPELVQNFNSDVKVSFILFVHNLMICALGTRGFSHVLTEGRSQEQRVTIKTWQKPKTVLIKSLAPRVDDLML